jgi:acyl-coenzyme A synthetase/AMP-(fatty) acid ligase
VPKEIHFIDEIPKGPSGKLLRRRLAEIYRERESAVHGPLTPEAQG